MTSIYESESITDYKQPHNREPTHSDSIISGRSLNGSTNPLREAKQRYLVKEIVEKGYRKEDFGEFLRFKRDSFVGQKALNIDSYTFEELESLVRDFQNQY